MYLSRLYKLAFLAHPRTGSRSMRDALTAHTNKLGFRQEGDHHSGPPQFAIDGYQPFFVVRNHWDAVASWYFNANAPPRQPPPITDEWCARFFPSHQNYFRPGRMWWFAEECPGARVLRFENLQNDLNQLLAQFGVPKEQLPVLPHVGKSQHREGRKYGELFTARARKFVEWLFLDEIQKYGYKFKN